MQRFTDSKKKLKFKLLKIIDDTSKLNPELT